MLWLLLILSTALYLFFQTLLLFRMLHIYAEYGPLFYLIIQELFFQSVYECSLL